MFIKKLQERLERLTQEQPLVATTMLATFSPSPLVREALYFALVVEQEVPVKS